jgi:hypothetical protein
MLGAVEQVCSMMMTVVTITAGLVPILWSTGAGSEVMQRIAVPMIGGMMSPTVLTLVIPAIFGLNEGCRLSSSAAQRQRPAVSAYDYGCATDRTGVVPYAKNAKFLAGEDEDRSRPKTLACDVELRHA